MSEGSDLLPPGQDHLRLSPAAHQVSASSSPGVCIARAGMWLSRIVIKMQAWPSPMN